MIALTPKRSKFSAAHSLACFGPDHPCARKHGHTWWVQATFEGEPDADGVLIDYAVVRDVVRLLDHEDLDPIFDGRATGENLVEWLRRRLSNRAALRPDCRLVRVELVEDPVPGDAHVLVWTA